jgi:hypothetical protein
VIIAAGGGIGGTGLVLNVLIGGVAWDPTGYTFADTNTHHIIAERDAGTIKTYVDGVQTANTSAASPVAPTSVAYIAAADSAGTPGRHVNSTIDEVAFYSRILTPSEKASHYQTGIGTQLPVVKNIRELPPLRLHGLLTTPNGNAYRWAQDERRPENCYSDLSFSTVMPGGAENCDCVLPRKTNVNYQDLTRLSTMQWKGAGGRIAGEYRLEKTPRVTSSSERSISPQLVGWQAHLDDDTSAAEVYLDRDLSHWQAASRALKIVRYATSGYEVVADASVDVDMTSGIPALNLTLTGTGSAIDCICEAFYDAGPGALVASTYYDYTSQNTTSSYTGQIGTSSDDIETSTSLSADLLTGTNSSGTGTQIGTANRFGVIQFSITGTPGDGDHVLMMRRLTQWGNHGLSKQGTAPNDGLYASDVIANAISRWAPLLRFTTGADGAIKPTSMIIPQLEFREMTTVSEILKQANRFSLNDWWVDEGDGNGPTFHYAERNSYGRKWRARVAPAKLSETGPQVDRLWDSVIVRFQDVDGTTRTVGPTGALTNTTSDSLLDTDPLNPINQLGIKRPAILDMGIVSTVDAATEVGRQFLIRAKDLDQSGSAEIVGHCEDDQGVMHPAWAVRAGDQISFVDAADTSYRRIVKTSYAHNERTNSIDLDSPPEGMDALLERLGASLYLGTPSVIPVGASGSGGNRNK